MFVCDMIDTSEGIDVNKTKVTQVHYLQLLLLS